MVGHSVRSPVSVFSLRDFSSLCTMASRKLFWKLSLKQNIHFTDKKKGIICFYYLMWHKYFFIWKEFVANILISRHCFAFIFMEFKQLNIWKEFVANTLKIIFPFSLDFWYLWQWEGWFQKILKRSFSMGCGHLYKSCSLLVNGDWTKDPMAAMHALYH